MLVDAHRPAALDDEQAVVDLGDPAANPHARRLMIEGYWGAADHWIAYGCETKHGRHRDNHQGLVSFLRQDGAEPHIAQLWERLENTRNGGWYGRQDTLDAVQRAHDLWQEIRTWALS